MVLKVLWPKPLVAVACLKSCYGHGHTGRIHRAVPETNRHFWATVCKTVRPMLSVRCLSCPVCPVYLSVTFVHCGQTVGRIKTKLGRPRPWPHCVRWGPSSLSPKGAQPPIFGPYLLRPNGCMDQDVTWYEARHRPKATLC